MKKSLQELPMTKEVASAIWAKKCLADKAWAKQIQSNPASAIDWGQDAQSVSTVQNTADTLNICVPDYEAMNNGTLEEISDEQMAGVSGGFFWFIPLIIGGAVAAGAGASIAASAGAFDEGE